MNEEILVTIDEQGAVEVSAKGVMGGKCKDLTKNIELALGKKIKDVETAEMRGVKQNNVNSNRA